MENKELEIIEEPVNKPPSKKQQVIKYIKAMPKKYFITAFSGMSIGLFCTLIAGTIIQTIALLFKDWALPVYDFLFKTGYVAKVMMGAGIGAGIAYAFKSHRLVLITTMAAGFMGAFSQEFFILSQGAAFTFGAGGLPGNPINSYICALFACELGQLVCGKTKLDIIVVPLTGLVIAALAAISIARPFTAFVDIIAQGISLATSAQPVIMCLVISLVMGLLLTLPTSSAAIGIAAQISGLGAGAAVAGCCSHMIGFAVISFRENGYSGLISQGLGTSMLQIPNVSRRPILLIPAMVASLVSSPIAVFAFKLQSTPVGSGMGTAGLVGIIETVSESIKAGNSAWFVVVGVIVSCIIVPAVVALLVSELMRKRGWIKPGDLKLEGN